MRRILKALLPFVFGLLIFTLSPLSSLAAGIQQKSPKSPAQSVLLDTLLLQHAFKGNNMQTKQFPTIPDGAIILGAKPYNPSLLDNMYGHFVHCALYDASSQTFISAMPKEGVRRETLDEWARSYGEVAIIQVKNVNSAQIEKIVKEATSYLGQPYVLSDKNDTTSWYCSKIPWFLYEKWANVNLEPYIHYYVTPDDLFKSPNVTLLWRG